MTIQPAHILPAVWNRKERPEEHPDYFRRAVRPVTWTDLGDRLHVASLRQFHVDASGCMDRYREEIQLFTETYDLGDVLWLHYSFAFARNFREVVDYIKARGLYVFDVWGYVPNRRKKGFPEYQARVTPHGDAHQYLVQTLGNHFLGWDNGEQDGRYAYEYAGLLCPAPRTRREGYEAFARFFYRLNKDMADYLVALLGLYFSHYVAHFGNHRLLGAETAQCLPSVPPWYAFIRGAGKQYGLLWFGNISGYNRWGYKKYGAADKKDPFVTSGQPDKGTSLELMKRLWFVEYMYGCCLLSFEQGQVEGIVSDEYLNRLEGDIDEDSRRAADPPRPLTPIGELQQACTAWCRQHPDVGVQHTPVALLMDFYAGWAPPRSVYQKPGEHFRVWGNLPYERGDHQADAFFRMVYPGYEDSGYFRDERGFLTATPAGDIFDVLLSNVSEAVLRRYQTLMALGTVVLEGKLLDKVLNAVRDGATLVCSACQLSGEARAAFGYRSDGLRKTARRSVVAGRTVEEPAFQYEAGAIAGARPLAASDTGEPLILRAPCGRGELILLTPDYGLQAQPNRTPLPADGVEHAFPLRYDFLHCVRDCLIAHFRTLNLVTVSGGPIQYLTNVTDDPKELIVTLCNLERATWSGALALTSGSLVGADDLFSGASRPVADGAARVEVPPLDVGIYRLTASARVMTVREAWRAPARTVRPLAIWSRADGDGTLWANIERIGRSSFGAVELCATQVLGLDDADLKRLAEELSAGALEIAALNLVHAQAPYVDGNDLSSVIVGRQHANRAFLARALAVARRLDCRRLILSPGRFYDDGARTWRATVRAIGDFAEEARESGIAVNVQPCPQRGFGTAADLVRLMEALDLPNLGVALDTGHAFWFEGDPVASLNACGPWVQYINLNSPVDDPDSGRLDVHAAPGTGRFDEPAMRALAAALEARRYEGWIGVNGFLADPTLDGLQALFRQCARVFGAGTCPAEAGEAWTLIPKPMFRAERFRKHAVLDRFHLVGPFVNADPAGQSLGLGQVCAPERGVDLQAAYPGCAGRPISWRRIGPDDLCGDGYVNLTYLLGDTGHAVAYACCVFAARQDAAITLLVGGDDGFAVWLNGREMHRHERALNSHARDNRDRLPLVLRAGRNEVLIKINRDAAVVRKIAKWGFSAGLAERHPDVELL